MPGASQHTRRVKLLNANWVPDAVGGDGQFTVLAWDPENGGTLIIANIVGTMPWTLTDDA